jgi:hypothetical protein
MCQDDLRTYLCRPLSRRERLARRWFSVWLRLLALVALSITMTGCGGQRERTPAPRWPPATVLPRRTPPPIAVTLAPTRVPIPTVSPLGTQPSTELAQPWTVLSRSLATPAAPALDSGASFLTKMRCYGDCVDLGNSSLMLHDFVADWSHPDPALVDEYEIWRATGDPYFDPTNCAGCTVTVSTGMTGTVEGSPPAFQPVHGYEEGGGSAVDTYVVRAVNGAGESEPSNRVGVIIYSFLTAIRTENPYWNVWPPPTPTYAP